MTNPDSILKSRDVTLLTKVHLVKARVFPVVMYGCESWSIKKAECWRTDIFELWCWRRLLRVPWTTRRSKPVNPKGNQSNQFIGRTDAEAETPIFWPHDAKSWLIGKDPDAAKDEGGRRGQQRMRWLDGITTQWICVWASSRTWGRNGKPGVWQSVGLQRVGHDWVTEPNWTRNK